MGLMAWYGKPNLDNYKYTKEMNMTKKEHTEVIDLVKNEHKSPLEDIEIIYQEHRDINTLSIELKVLLNNKHIGNIIADKSSSFHPYSFKSMSAICEDTSGKDVAAVKINIEKKIDKIVKCFKEW
jgi:hypothetical protein